MYSSTHCGKIKKEKNKNLAQVPQAFAVSQNRLRNHNKEKVLLWSFLSECCWTMWLSWTPSHTSQWTEGKERTMTFAVVVQQNKLQPKSSPCSCRQVELLHIHLNTANPYLLIHKDRRGRKNMLVFCLYRRSFVQSLLLSRNHSISLDEHFLSPKHPSLSRGMQQLIPGRIKLQPALTMPQ